MLSKRILIIESDNTTALLETTALEKAGYSVIRASDASDGLKKLFEALPDLIIMSGELPLIDAEYPLWQIRQASYIPIIVVGSKRNEVETLEMGADYYLVKPPGNAELVARVGALLRRKSKHDPRQGNTIPDVENPLKDKKNGTSELTSTEFRLASCLMYNEGILVDNHQLISEVWGGKRVSLATLHFYIRSLRKKLETGGIYGIRGAGYWFTGQASSPN